jgi:hypothetical protein
MREEGWSFFTRNMQLDQWVDHGSLKSKLQLIPKQHSVLDREPRSLSILQIDPPLGFSIEGE